MTPSEAEKHGYERVNKYPKSTKFGRQNPISERWNSEEQLVAWRKLHRYQQEGRQQPKRSVKKKSMDRER